MQQWLSFSLFLVAGLGMFVTGACYMQKEKGDAEAVKIYRTVSIIGVVLATGAVIVKFLL